MPRLWGNVNVAARKGFTLSRPRTNGTSKRRGDQSTWFLENSEQILEASSMQRTGAPPRSPSSSPETI
ncbi:hypothetical protein HanXRQr2_Chr08g0322681 [Helianthus annuus]|uniref:Uncharacterized protein n=1 Tax=Helianthus annuus TaxID=4232 RepID=A0A9K3IBK8_HELAN|nr:hypothetical protein HanXRQr2_Chr08g0322681 [Helianthus annuus]KAJ0900325.1 hypothetical protein HanPSC8_Chr08g0312571 [Helianthus annuus]